MHAFKFSYGNKQEFIHFNMLLISFMRASFYYSPTSILVLSSIVFYIWYSIQPNCGIQPTLKALFRHYRISPIMPRMCIPHSWIIYFFWEKNASLSIVPLPLKEQWLYLYFTSAKYTVIDYLYLSYMHQTAHAVRMFYNRYIYRYRLMVMHLCIPIKNGVYITKIV